jgi:hypothetical protein
MPTYHYRFRTSGHEEGLLYVEGAPYVFRGAG